MKADLSFNENEFVEFNIPTTGIVLLEKLRQESKKCTDEEPSEKYVDILGEVYDYFNAIGKTIFAKDDIEIYSIDHTWLEDIDTPLSDVPVMSTSDMFIIDVDFTYCDNVEDKKEENELRDLDLDLESNSIPRPHLYVNRD